MKRGNGGGGHGAFAARLIYLASDLRGGQGGAEPCALDRGESAVLRHLLDGVPLVELVGESGSVVRTREALDKICEGWSTDDVKALLLAPELDPMLVSVDPVRTAKR